MKGAKPSEPRMCCRKQGAAGTWGGGVWRSPHCSDSTGLGVIMVGNERGLDPPVGPSLEPLQRCESLCPADPSPAIGAPLIPLPAPDGAPPPRPPPNKVWESPLRSRRPTSPPPKKKHRCKKSEPRRSVIHRAAPEPLRSTRWRCGRPGSDRSPSGTGDNGAAAGRGTERRSVPTHEVPASPNRRSPPPRGFGHLRDPRRYRALERRRRPSGTEVAPQRSHPA